MEPTKNQISLTERIAQWQTVIAGGALTQEDISELTIHLEDSLKTYTDMGLSENDVWLLAIHHIGNPKMLDEEFEKVNPDFIARRNWMMLLWGAMGFFLLQTLFIEIPMIYRLILFPRELLISNQRPHLVVYYSISVVFILLILGITYNGTRLTAWFNRLLIKHGSVLVICAIFIGLIAAFVNFLVLISSRLAAPPYPVGNGYNEAFCTLIFVFYISLIALTAYTTLRHRSPEIRSFNTFVKNINWKYAFVFGFIAQVPIQYSLQFQIYILPGLLAVILFGVIGWMLSNSKKGWLNIAFAQFVPMLMLINGWSVNSIPIARMYFSFEYACTLLALVIMYLTGKYIAQRKVIASSIKTGI